MGGNIMAAKLVRRAAPVYPRDALRQGIQGTVRLRAIIDKQGAVRDLRLLQGICSLSKAAIDAVKQWRYTPTTLNGQPVEIDTTIDVTFSVNRY